MVAVETEPSGVDFEIRVEEMWGKRREKEALEGGGRAGRERGGCFSPDVAGAGGPSRWLQLSPRHSMGSSDSAFLAIF